MTSSPNIAPSANVSRNAVLCDNVWVCEDVTLGEVYVGPNSTVMHGSDIWHESYLVEDVLVGPYVSIGSRVLIMGGARICPNEVRSTSSDGRSVEDDVIIGSDVLIHDEAEIGSEAIIPTQKTIACIGNFGSKNRVITIYGSNEGPLYSLGCKIGTSYNTIRREILNPRFSSIESADSYFPYLQIFQDIGAVVQLAYEKEAKLIEELLATRGSLI